MRRRCRYSRWCGGSRGHGRRRRGCCVRGHTARRNRGTIQYVHVQYTLRARYLRTEEEPG
eukprot:841184-Pleurochrysis_carterae.AAC.1